MISPFNIFFIVSANSKIGYGHLKRCLLIADEFLLHGVISNFFVFGVDDKAILDLIKEKGFNSIIINNQYNLSEYFKYLKISNRNLLIIDSDDKQLYHENFQKEIIDKKNRLMYITLHNDIHYYSHYLLNPNIVSLTQKYSTENYTKKLLGPEYFILDDKFKKIKPNNLVKGNRVNLLITFGSADPSNITIKILDLLESKVDFFHKIRIVVGGLNPRIKEIKSHPLVNKHPENFEIHVDTNIMYELMAKSELAITSLGLTFWELLLHKVSCFVISGSEREKKLLKYFRKNEYCFYIGDYDNKKWQNDWNNELNFYLKKNIFISTNIEKLYNSVNVNGKTKLVDTILKDYE